LRQNQIKKKMLRYNNIKKILKAKKIRKRKKRFW